MPDAKLAGPVLFIAGSAVLLSSFITPLHLDQGGYTGLTLMVLGIITGLVAWRNEAAEALLPAPYLRRRNGAGPAKHLKIRIRCAR